MVEGQLSRSLMPFQAISEAVGQPVDQVRYVVLLLLSYPLALFLRHGLNPRHTPLIVRHGFSLSAGVAMGLLCFGWQMMVIIGVIGVSYILLLYIPPRVVQRYTMVWAMGSMSVCHIYRMATDYEGNHLDFTTPLMLIVQKVTLVAFALHDGFQRKEDLNEDHEREKISAPPSLLDYLSYTLSFQMFLTGPTVPLCDYLAFMDGSNMSPRSGGKGSIPVLSKFSWSMVALAVYLTLSEYTVPALLDPKSHGNLLSLIIITYITGVGGRSKYHFIWLLTESVNNASGLGFRGYDENGRPLWDLATIIVPQDVEFPTSPRSMLVGWNKSTTLWLRRVCNDRVRWHPALVSFFLSALWHGFYPAYYLSFIFLGFLIEAARKMRYWLRPHFQGSRAAARTYDVITGVTTHIYVGFGVPPFQMYRTQNALLYWSYYYYFPLISAIAIVLFLPGKKQQRHTPTTATKGKNVFSSEARATAEQGYKED